MPATAGPPPPPPAAAAPPPPAAAAPTPPPATAAPPPPPPPAAPPPVMPPPPPRAAVRRSSRIVQRIEQAAAQAPPEGDEAGDEAPVAPTWELKRLIQHRKLSASFAKARGPAHEGCVAAGRRVFQVEWLPPWTPTWECECDVGRAAVLEYDEAKEAARAAAAERRAAKRARVEVAAAADGAEGSQPAAGAEDARARNERAAERAAKRARAPAEGAAAATLPPELESSGDMAIWDAEKREMDRLTDGCNNLKENQYKTGKATAHVPKAMSAGVLALISSCGLFVSIKEMTENESLQQVHLFLYEVFFRDKLPVPKVLCYDDACHLLLYLRNRANNYKKYGYSEFAWWLLYSMAVKVVCDRFHFPNHKNNAFCKANVDPEKCPELGPRTNTEAAEEAFAWLARSKHIYKNMGQGRFVFVMLRMIELRNRWLEGTAVRSRA